MSEGAVRLPRWLIVLIVAAVAVAAGASYVGSRLSEGALAPPTGAQPADGVGVIRRPVEVADAAPRIGAFAPDFEWTAPDGRSARLAELRGRTLIVNFWATWCVPCRTEMPIVDAIARADADLVVLGIDLQEDAPAVRAFFDHYGLSAIRPLLDPDGETFRRWNVLTLPTTFFVDRDGRIQHLAIGAIGEDAIREGIRRARAA